MTYNPTNLTFETRTSLDHRVWNYSTSDNISTIQGSGYFNPHPMCTGDILRVTANDDNVVYQCFTGDPNAGAGLRKLATGVTTFVNSTTGP